MYCHLKFKSEYSICTSTNRIKQAVSFAKENGFESLGICDDGNLFGSLEFANACVTEGIKPIIGVEMKFCNEEMLQIGAVSLFAKNQEGYRNILKISNANEGIDNSGNVVLETIKSYFQGVIAISSSADVLKALGNFFDKECLFAEVSRFSDEENEIIDEANLVNFASANKIPLVATNASYFLKEGGFVPQDILYCIKNGRYLLEDNRPMFTENHYFKKNDEMEKLFLDIPSAIENLNFIEKNCNYFPKPSSPMLPKFAEDESFELKRQAGEGLLQRIQDFGIAKGFKKEDYEKRLKYEIGVISSMGFEGYFLIVSDFIKWSKNNGVAVGPGRGSGAGSLVAYCLYITDLDPLRYGLLFERFLNPERVSMPDFDIDFCQEERHKVITYVQEKYGSDRVSAIATYGRLQARAVLKDVARVVHLPYVVVDRICKMVPFNPVAPVTLEQAVNMDKDLQEAKSSDEVIENLIETGMVLEGLARHISTHAAGIIIANEELASIVPLYKAPEQDIPAVGYSMKMAEMAGLVKFDFLGLKTLTIIKRTCTLVKENFGVEVVPSQIPLDDEKTFELLQNGFTKGVFQLDSSVCRDSMKQMKIDLIDDIIALTSLNRPGPMENIPSFISRKVGKEKVEYPHSLLEEVLRETYGIIIYQEQVIKIAQVLAGYSLGEADLLRRAMGKKNKEEMDRQKERFVIGAKENGIDVKKADEIFALVEKFAGYGFNKSHAAAYSVISFYTAYLKAHYKLEFYASILNLDIHNTDNINIFIAEAKQCDVEFLSPNVNTSGTYFKVVEGKIEYALSAIKGVGEMTTVAIENERKNGNFQDIFDFTERLGSKFANKKVLEGLIKAGAFKTLHNNSKQLVKNVQAIIAVGESKKEETMDSLFGESEVKSRPVLQKCEDFSLNEELTAEFDAFGFYFSTHPLSHFGEVLKKYNVKQFADVADLLPQDGKEVYIKMAGVVSIIKQRSGKRGRFAFLHLSDLTGVFEVAIFKDDIIEQNRENLQVGKVVIANISASLHESGNVRLIVNDISSMEDSQKISEFKTGNAGNKFQKKDEVKSEVTNTSNILQAKKMRLLANDINFISELKNLNIGKTELCICLDGFNVVLGKFEISMKLVRFLQELEGVEVSLDSFL